MFEYFREGHVPECDDAEDLPDIFNNASGLDPEPVDVGDPGADADQQPAVDPDEEPDIEDESLF
jgi:hypothetical protein